jgi:predicted Zn finger-like uncharacterized protein
MGRFLITKIEGLSKYHPRRVECPKCGTEYEVTDDLGTGDDYVHCLGCDGTFQIGTFTETHYYAS